MLDVKICKPDSRRRKGTMYLDSDRLSKRGVRPITRVTGPRGPRFAPCCTSRPTMTASEDGEDTQLKVAESKPELEPASGSDWS